ncbi:hypothetical protein KKA17_06045 [bacterium]|nr:hypothetical protein [bacterium]MBU1884454.1 hypothetical protein [bacterium]
MIRFAIFLFILTMSLNAMNVVKEYRYMASDSDSKTSAKNQALKTLKNLVIEELGSGIAKRFEKNEKVEDENMQRELRLSVNSFTNAFIQSKIIDESWDGSSYWLKASIDVDDKGLYEKLKLHYEELQAQSKGEELEAMLEDISTKEKLDSFIDKAITLPFTQDIGSKAHMKALRIFTYNKIFDERYRNFLIETLKTIEYPSWDSRTETILTYLQGSRPYDKKERKVLLKILENTQVAKSVWALEPMLAPNARVCDEGVDELMENYLKLIRDGKAGLPVYTDLHHELAFVVEGWSHTLNAECPFLGSDAILEALKSDEADTLKGDIWTKVIKKAAVASDKNHTDANKKLPALVKVCAPHLPEDNNAIDAIKELYKRTDTTLHATLTTILLADIRRIYAKQTLYDNDIAFCIANGITVPDKVFTLQEYYKKLYDEPQESHRRAWVDAIVDYGIANGGKNHQEYLNALRFLDEKKDHYDAEVLSRVMEKIGYEDETSIMLLSKFLSSQNPNISRRSSGYLLKCDNPTKRINAIIGVLPKLSPQEQRRVITFFIYFKEPAAQALAKLEAYRTSKDSDLRYSVEWLEKNLKKDGYM